MKLIFCIVCLLIFTNLYALSMSANLNTNKSNNSDIKLMGGAVDGGGVGFDFYFNGKSWFSTFKENPMEQVKYCIVIKSQHLITEEDIDKRFEKIRKTWFEYIDERSFDQFEHIKYVRNYQLQKKCDETTNLRIYIGELPQKYLDLLNLNPLTFGFAYRFNLSKEESRNPFAVSRKGMIWLNYDFLYENNEQNMGEFFNEKLDRIFLHEFGHVIGSKHIDGTVMSPYLIAELWSWDELKEIDDPMRLESSKMLGILPFNTNEDGDESQDVLKTFNGKFGYDIYNRNKKIFKILTNKEIQNPMVKSTLVINMSPGNFLLSEKLELILKADGIEYRFYTKPYLEKPGFISMSTSIFGFMENNFKQEYITKIAELNYYNNIASIFNAKPLNMIMDLYLQDNPNKTWKALLNVNMDSIVAEEIFTEEYRYNSISPIKLHLISDEGVFPLFHNYVKLKRKEPNTKVLKKIIK